MSTAALSTVRALAARGGRLGRSLARRLAGPSPAVLLLAGCAARPCADWDKIPRKGDEVHPSGGGGQPAIGRY